MSEPESPEARRLSALRLFDAQLLGEMADCGSKRDLAALGRLHVDVLAQIEALEKAQPAAKGTALDEFTRRRAEREATSSPRSARRQQRG